MKTRLLIIILFSGFLFYSCGDELDTIYPYEAVVLGINNDCGAYQIKITDGLEQVRLMVADFGDGIYIVKNLPEDLQKEGQEIKLDVRAPFSGELSPCTTMGLAYPWLYVIEAKKR